MVIQNQVEEQNRRTRPLIQLGIDLKRLEIEYLSNLEEMDDVKHGLGHSIPAEGAQRPGSQERFDLANSVKGF